MGGVVKSHTETHLSLSPAWAFVVQFRATRQGQPSRWEGRVEHVVSSQAATFHSQQELLAFLESMLERRNAKPTQD